MSETTSDPAGPGPTTPSSEPPPPMRPTLSPTLETHPGLSAAELRDVWMILTPDERFDGFRLLPRGDAEEFFLELGARDHAELILGLPGTERRVWMRLLAPDDAADVLQAAPPESKDELLALLDTRTRNEVSALLAYAEDEAGGLMNPRFARLRPDATVDEAIGYLRRQARGRIETIYYVYVLDEQQRLLGVVSFRELFSMDPTQSIRDIMHIDLISVREDEHQEAVSRIISQHGLQAV
ncbi:MAG TPA: CBS domain-containing protein, partial [Polyangiaceae bacterium]|nr:CBS domain-containing protein [Polyangiaceae bacterium]